MKNGSSLAAEIDRRLGDVTAEQAPWLAGAVVNEVRTLMADEARLVRLSGATGTSSRERSNPWAAVRRTADRDITGPLRPSAEIARLLRYVTPALNPRWWAAFDAGVSDVESLGPGQDRLAALFVNPADSFMSKFRARLIESRATWLSSVVEPLVEAVARGRVNLWGRRVGVPGALTALIPADLLVGRQWRIERHTPEGAQDGFSFTGHAPADRWDDVYVVEAGFPQEKPTKAPNIVSVLMESEPEAAPLSIVRATANRRGPKPVLLRAVIQQMIIDYAKAPDQLKTETAEVLAARYETLMAEVMNGRVAVRLSTIRNAKIAALEKLQQNSNKTPIKNK